MQRYSPDELYEKFRTAHDAAGTEDFFNRPEHKKTQEQWCAAQFGRTYLANVGGCSILISDKDEQTEADFYLEVSGARHSFQITEVQPPGRRRGDEYKGGKSKGATLESWDTGTENGPAWIYQAVKKKHDRYGGDVKGLNLLVYANFTAYEHDYDDIRRAVGELATRFASVWVLNGNGACCIDGVGELGSPRQWLFRPKESGSEL